MPYQKPTNFADAIQYAIDEQIFIEWINVKFGAPEKVIRELIAEVGLSLPKVYEKLRQSGYSVPIHSRAL